MKLKTIYIDAVSGNYFFIENQGLIVVPFWRFYWLLALRWLIRLIDRPMQKYLRLQVIKSCNEEVPF